MNLVGHREWRQKVTLNYGSLTEFPDARTIRIMLGFLREKIAEELQFRDTLKDHPEERADWIKHSNPELFDALDFVAELEGWLNDRGLVES